VGFIYQPGQERQIKPGDKRGRWNCGPTTGAVFIDRATLGGVMVDAADVRLASDEPIPDPDNPGPSPGLNIKQLAAAIRTFGVEVTLGRPTDTFDDVLDRLREGRCVTISGVGAALGKDTCQPGFTGGHAIFLNNLSTSGVSILTYNPLCPNYRWLPVATVRKYAERFGALHGGLAYAYTRITPNIAPADQVN